MSIEEILESNNLPLIKQHLRRLYDNYEIATKTELENVAEKIELLKEIETLKINNKMNQFKQYRRKQIAELRPIETHEIEYFKKEGELRIHLDVFVSISKEDINNGSPKTGDMIARNPKNHTDQWLVAEQYFKDNFEIIDNA